MTEDLRPRLCLRGGLRRGIAPTETVAFHTIFALCQQLIYISP